MKADLTIDTIDIFNRLNVIDEMRSLQVDLTIDRNDIFKDRFQY